MHIEFTFKFQVQICILNNLNFLEDYIQTNLITIEYLPFFPGKPNLEFLPSFYLEPQSSMTRVQILVM